MAAIFHAKVSFDWVLLDERQDLQLNVVNINVSFRSPATLGQVLRVRSRLSRVGLRSATVHQEVIRREEDLLVADAEVTFVLVGPGGVASCGAHGRADRWTMGARGESRLSRGSAD